MAKLVNNSGFNLSEYELNVNYPVLIEKGERLSFKELESHKEAAKLREEGFIAFNPYIICCKVKIPFPFLKINPSGMIITITTKEDITKLINAGILKEKETVITTEAEKLEKESEKEEIKKVEEKTIEIEELTKEPKIEESKESEKVIEEVTVESKKTKRSRRKKKKGK